MLCQPRAASFLEHPNLITSTERVNSTVPQVSSDFFFCQQRLIVRTNCVGRCTRLTLLDDRHRTEYVRAFLRGLIKHFTTICMKLRCYQIAVPGCHPLMVLYAREFCTDVLVLRLGSEARIRVLQFQCCASLRCRKPSMSDHCSPPSVRHCLKLAMSISCLVMDALPTRKLRLHLPLQLQLSPGTDGQCKT